LLARSDELSEELDKHDNDTNQDFVDADNALHSSEPNSPEYAQAAERMDSIMEKRVIIEEKL
jgi:hypothetical protein